MYYEESGGTIVQYPFVAVQASGGPQLCVFGATHLECYTATRLFTSSFFANALASYLTTGYGSGVPTAATIIGDTYFYTEGHFVKSSI